MFCKNCGNELADDAKFCNKCGASIDGEQKPKEKKVEDNTVKYQIKPSFKWGYKLLTNCAYAALIILIAGIIMLFMYLHPSKAPSFIVSTVLGIV